MAIEAGADTEADEWAALRRLAIATRNVAQGYTTRLAAGDVTPEYIYSTVYYQMNEQRVALSNFTISPALSQFVKDRRNNQAYDIQAEVNTAITLIQAVLDWMSTTATGLTYPAEDPANFGTTGSVTTRTFSPAQTSAVRTLLQAVVTHINEA